MSKAPDREAAAAIKIPLSKLTPLFTRVVSSEGLEELAQTIKFTGILEPLVVRAKDYGIIAGYRRYKAAQKAGLVEVPAVIVECDDAEAFRLSLVENLQRENMSDYELAKRLKEFKARTGFTEEQLGALIGKSKFWVSHHLAMLKLEGKLSRDNMEKLTEYHARAILSQPDVIQKPLLEEVEKAIVERGEPPSVREIERKAKELLKSPAEEEEVGGESVEATLKAAEEAATAPGAGEFVELKSPEDVDRFFDEILKASRGAAHDVEKFTCVCGCGWTIEVDWKNRRVEWVTP